MSFNQGSTPDTTPSGSITLKDLDIGKNITLEAGESVEWSISGSSAVITGNGTSADIVFSGIDYARLAAGNHDFVETVTAKIMKDGKVVRTITGKVRLVSNIIRNSRVNILSADFEIELVQVWHGWYFPIAYLKLAVEDTTELSCGSNIKISGKGLFLFSNRSEFETQATKTPNYHGMADNNTYRFGWCEAYKLQTYLLTPLGGKGFIFIEPYNPWYGHMSAFCIGLSSQTGLIKSINGNEIIVNIDWFIIGQYFGMPFIAEFLPSNTPSSRAQIDTNLNGPWATAFKNPYSRQNHMKCDDAYLEIL